MESADGQCETPPWAANGAGAECRGACYYWSALSVDKRCSVLTLSSRVFTKGRMRESESRDGGISLERVGPPVLSQSGSTYR